MNLGLGDKGNWESRCNVGLKISIRVLFWPAVTYLIFYICLNHKSNFCLLHASVTIFEITALLSVDMNNVLCHTCI